MKQEHTMLGDHADMRMITTDQEAATDRRKIVQLDPDHPGFRDPEYRARRNAIATIALAYESGDPIPDAPYTHQEHDVWRTIWHELGSAHAQFACAEYLSCLQKMDLDRNQIPQLREVSERVERLSGFRLEPVAGLVEPRVFLESLADGIFLCTQYIRHHSTPLYTPEPDVAHEIIGHAITLASPRLAQLNRMFGEAVKRTRSLDALNRLSRVYWFTIEFGVLREDGAIKAYGTGLLSSAGELRALSNAELLPLDLDVAARHEYDPTHFQPKLFCADSFDVMEEKLTEFLGQW